MLLGEYHHNIDEKNRIVIPTVFREELGSDFIITKGIDKCLYVYSKDKWKQLVSKLDTLTFTKKVTRTFTRFFYAGAMFTSFDKSGRINITSPLVTYAGLDKECVIIGVNDHLEIWDRESFNAFINESSNVIETIAENLFEGE